MVEVYATHPPVACPYYVLPRRRSSLRTRTLREPPGARGLDAVPMRTWYAVATARARTRVRGTGTLGDCRLDVRGTQPYRRRDEIGPATWDVRTGTSTGYTYMYIVL